MYVYLYDNFLRDKKFLPTVKTIEVRLTDYGIAGKIIRLTNYADAKPIIEDEIKRGAQTVVIVGNDETLGYVLAKSATCQVVFGFLPVGPGNTIAEVLGIPVGVDSVDVLSRRKREVLDVGWVNNRYFISQLHIPPARVEVVYDERFKVSSRGLLEVVVCNLQPFFWKRLPRDPQYQVVHPQDGKLEAFLRPLTKRRWFGYTVEEPSVFPFEEMQVMGREPFAVKADGKITKEIKITIRLAHNKIDMIVGRNRKF